MSKFAALAFVLIVAGCQTTPAKPTFTFVRVDGRKVAGNVELETRFKQDTAICMGETNKSAIAAPMAQHSLSLADNLAADQINSGRSKALSSIYQGCMAERGYAKAPEGHVAQIEVVNGDVRKITH